MAKDSGEVQSSVAKSPSRVNLHRGKQFLVPQVGSWNNDFLNRSFELEWNLRENWWEIQPGELVIDAGAGYGSYTLSALAAGAVVFAFEPNCAELFELCTALMANCYQPRCILFNCLLGNRSGICDYYPETHSTTYEMDWNDFGYDTKPPPEQRFIMSLDSITKQFNPKQVDWIKIDVEGMEVEVVDGALTTIRKYRPKMIIENHKQFVPDVMKQIEDMLLPLDYAEQVWDMNEGNNCWSRWLPVEKAIWST